MTLSDKPQTFPAVISELHNMLDSIKRAGKRTSLKQERLAKLELACEEFIVNIISYAYKNTPSTGTVEISCLDNGLYFEVTIKDYGQHFDPLQVAVDVTEDLPLEERELGGLGIFLAKSSVDELHYERLDNANTLHIRVYFNN